MRSKEPVEIIEILRLTGICLSLRGTITKVTDITKLLHV